MNQQMRDWLPRLAISVFALTGAFVLLALIVKWCSPPIALEGQARYEFAKPFCLGRSVADIASGPGGGTAVLRQTAASADGYDIVDYGNNRVIDLDKQDWGRHYDVIVSFETIEHLANPAFFLNNARRTCRSLLLSTPANEKPAGSPYHKQFWTFPELRALVETSFSCQWHAHDEEGIQPGMIPEKTAIAVCTPRENTHPYAALDEAIKKVEGG